jgi:hypothetical protein
LYCFTLIEAKPLCFVVVSVQIYFMKIIKYLFSLVIGSLITTVSVQAQNQSGLDSTGLPGDNFSLQGALQMFQNASSPEEFEKAINTEGNHVNNLDLNGDGDIDYIRVISKMDKDVHVFILQAPVSETESQDIAVIELEKTGDATAVLQIVGDEDIYGEQVIVEPDGGGDNEASINYSNNSNLSGPDASFDVVMPRIVVNVWFWPGVRFVYAPAYRPWVSPWRWRHHPGWWRPWRPFTWHVWHPFRAHYHRPFVVVRTHRVVHAHRIYTPVRTSSVVVRTRHSASVNNYRVTRSRTTVTGPKGNSATVKKTTVAGPKGRKATKVKVRRH